MRSLVVGIGLGAVMRGYIPNEFLVKYAGPGYPFAVPLAVLVAVPLRSDGARVNPMDMDIISAGMGEVLNGEHNEPCG